MLRENPKERGQEDLFRSLLVNMIDLRHPLVQLSRLVDWDGLASDFAQYYCADNGRPGKSIRLMAGLCLLKDMKGLSDEEVCATWRENPYFQYFCGEEFFQHRLPVEPPSLSIFRKRIGEAGLQRLLQETVQLGLKTGTINQKDLQVVTVDTTVQEKAVQFPTDSRLCHKARAELVDLARQFGIALRQSYTRSSKKALFMANRYLSARQMNRGRKEIKKLRNYLGRVMRDIERSGTISEIIQSALDKAAIIYGQTLNPQAANKLYSWHAPEVECIAKGKAHKKYEFGCKASLAGTNKSNFMVGAMAHHGKPYDGHTLSTVLTHIQSITGVKPKEAYVDQGYRGHGVPATDTTVILARQKRSVSKAQRKRQHRRNALEPMIGHCKNDRKVGPRSWLRGKLGDQINIIASAIGYNMRKILNKIFLYLFAKLLQVFYPTQNRIHYA